MSEGGAAVLPLSLLVMCLDSLPSLGLVIPLDFLTSERSHIEVLLESNDVGAGEMAQMVRALAVLSEDPGSFPSTRMAAPVSGNLTPSVHIK